MCGVMRDNLPIIVPGLITNNQQELDNMLKTVEGSVNRIMLDIMDGFFVQNHSLDFDFHIPRPSEICIEAHLMVCKPLDWIKNYSHKVDIALIHVETVLRDIKGAIEFTKEKGLKTYLALNPETKVEVIRPYLGMIDGVLVLTVHPGGYSAPLQRKTLKKVKSVRRLAPDLPIEVDGAMNPQNVRLAWEAGATIFASGSFIMKSADPRKAIKELQIAID